MALKCLRCVQTQDKAHIGVVCITTFLSNDTDPNKERKRLQHLTAQQFICMNIVSLTCYVMAVSLKAAPVRISK